MRPVGRLVVLSLLALSAACARRPRAGERSRIDRNVITQEQILANHFANAFDAVEALRSNWLHTRGTDSFRTPGQVWVYLDNVRMGGVESLRSITTESIAFVRYFDGVAATERWGLDHGQGVIFVSTHR